MDILLRFDAASCLSVRKNRVHVFALAFLSMLCFWTVSKSSAQSKLSIIPAPQKMILRNGSFCFVNAFKLQSDVGLDSLHAFLAGELNKRFNLHPAEGEGINHTISLRLDKNLQGDERYKLIVRSNRIEIISKSPHGVFDGIQSLLQLMYNGQQDDKKSISVPACRINDHPRFKWRGFMVDESRHFFGKEKIEQLLDLMALHKLNVFHWHLTDEPAWRIQINGYPNLTNIGSKGNWSNPAAPARYYSKQDIRDIVAYARKRFIKIIPEIDMPGHASAANLAYPEFSGGGSENHPDFTFNPGRTSTYQYLTNILREVVAIFPSHYVHIGGDEVHYGNQEWKTDPDVHRLMKKENLKNIKAVESYFISRMADSVQALGAKVVGWDEVANADINKKDNVIMWWRHNRPDVLDSVLQKGYQTVLCPRIPMYFDFVQDSSHHLGRRWNGFSDLKTVYKFPSSLKINVADNPHILGVQANLWTETVDTKKRFDYMIWPRLSAMAEAAWTLPNRKSYSSFKMRLKNILFILDEYGIHYFDPFDPEATPEPSGPTHVNWQENHQ